MTNENNVNYIDVARGIGIVLVVLGHCISKQMAEESMLLNVLRIVIYVVHMPVFFVISGWLFEKNTAKYKKSSITNYTKKKFAVFFIPYLLFSACTYLVIWSCINFFPSVGGILVQQGYQFNGFTQVIKEVLIYQNHQDGHLWFCYVMFLVLLINRVLIDHKEPYLIALFGVATICVLYYSPYLPELLFRTVKYTFLFMVGRLLYGYQFKRTSCASLIVSLASIFLYVVLQLEEMRFARLIVLPVAEISSAISIIFVISKSLDNSAVGRFFKYFGTGRVSYAIYLVHMPFITSSLVFLMTKAKIIPDIVVVLSSATLAMLISIVVFKLLSCSKLIRKLCFGMN